jgi:hypothetical protein
VSNTCESDEILWREREGYAASAKIAAHEVIQAIRRGDILVTEYLNQQSAARYCGYSAQFFNKACRSGKGPRHVMVGTRWRTRRAWLDRWMETGGPHGSIIKEQSNGR